MQIDTLSSANLEALIQLVQELWPDSSLQEELENFRTVMDSDNEICYLAKDLDMYIAFVHVSLRADYVEGAAHLPVAYIEGMYVRPAYQNKGIARSLIETAENWSRQKGVKQLASDTVLSNTASIDFHKKVGFTEVEKIVCFIKDL